MSIASEIARLQAAKVDIMAALVEKGVDVTGKNLVDVPDLIDSIEVGPKVLIIDGLEYRTVVMPDGREWMAENLQAEQGSAAFYKNDETTYGRNGKNYGRLYNWNDAMSLANRVDGWHLPTTQEWDVLATAVGGASVAGTMLKATTGWSSGNGSDNYGFSVFPAGYWFNSAFNSVGSNAYLWTATEDVSSHAYYRYFSTGASVGSGVDNKTSYAYSVRLIKDA